MSPHPPRKSPASRGVALAGHVQFALEAVLDENCIIPHTNLDATPSHKDRPQLWSAPESGRLSGECDIAIGMDQPCHRVLRSRWQSLLKSQPRPDNCLQSGQASSLLPPSPILRHNDRGKGHG